MDSTLGARYMLPLLLIADARIDTDGKVLANWSGTISRSPPASRLSFSLNTDRDYSVARTTS